MMCFYLKFAVEDYLLDIRYLVVYDSDVPLSRADRSVLIAPVSDSNRRCRPSINSNFIVREDEVLVECQRRP
jgi:hypothetical protein